MSVESRLSYQYLKQLRKRAWGWAGRLSSIICLICHLNFILAVWKPAKSFGNTSAFTMEVLI